MWEPEIIQREEDRSLIWIAAPFEMPRATYPLVGRTLLWMVYPIASRR